MYLLTDPGKPDKVKEQVQQFMRTHQLTKCYQVGAGLFKHERNAKEYGKDHTLEVITHDALELHNENPAPEAD